MANLVIAVTDRDWFDALRRRSDLAEVNFWAPTTRNFRALQPGELLLFKLRVSDNAFIVGGGVFAHASRLPCSLAWEAFGEANGACSAQEMRTLIASRRRASRNDSSDFEVGCRILTQPFFFEKRDWMPVPSSWKRRTTAGYKKYNTDDPEAMKLWKIARDRRYREEIGDISEAQARFGKPCLVHTRLGQSAFRKLVRNAYECRCAVTQERTLAALDAAHIRPYGDGGKHEANNGLFLRKDIHSLFDAGYVTVTPGNRFKVSTRIREQFGGESDYYALHDREIMLPENKEARPNPDFLRWHNENRFNA